MVRVVRMAKMARMGSPINWSGDGLTASAETAVAARWTVSARESLLCGVFLCKACPYIATGCAASERVCV